MLNNSSASKTAIYSAAYNYIGKAVSTIFTILSFIIVVRALNVEDYARYTSYLNAVFFVTLFLDFGIAEVLLRYIPEYLQKKELPFIKNLINASAGVITAGCAILLLASTLASIIFPGIIAKFQLGGIVLYLVIFGWIKIISIILGSALNAFFFQFFRITAELITSGLKLALIYVAAHCGATSWSLVVIYALIDLLLAALFWGRIHKYLGKVKAVTDKDGLSRMTKFGFNEYMYRLFWFFADNRFDIYIVGLILGLTQAGYFAFAASIVNLLIDWSPGFVIKPIITPLFIRKYTDKKNMGQIQYLFQLHNKFLVFITLPVFFFMGILMDKFILYVFDPKYLPSMHVFLVFIVSMFFINFIIPLRNIIALVERPDISNLTNVVAIPKIILVIIFSKLFGIMGAAVAYAASLFFIIWINIVLINKVIKLTYPWRSLSKMLVNSIVMGLIVYFLRDNINGKLSLLAIAMAGGISYLAVSFINKAFNQEDRDLFNNAIKIKLWHF